MRSQKLGHTQTGYVMVAGYCSVFAEGSPGRSAWAIQFLSQQATDHSALIPSSVHDRFHVSCPRLPTPPHCWQWWSLDQYETRIV